MSPGKAGSCPRPSAGARPQLLGLLLGVGGPEAGRWRDSPRFSWTPTHRPPRTSPLSSALSPAQWAGSSSCALSGPATQQRPWAASTRS